MQSLQDEQFDSECGICFMIMVEPAKYPCQHKFCLQCTKQLYETEHTQKCPLCREALPNKIEMDKEHAKKIQDSFPDEYKKQLEYLKKSV